MESWRSGRGLSIDRILRPLLEDRALQAMRVEAADDVPLAADVDFESPAAPGGVAHRAIQSETPPPSEVLAQGTIQTHACVADAVQVERAPDQTQPAEANRQPGLVDFHNH